MTTIRSAAYLAIEMKSEYEIVSLTEAHLADVAELERLCFAEPWSENSLRLLCEEGGFGAVAVSEGRVIAYAGMTTVLDEGAITNIATHPSARRQGFGRAVTEALLTYARAHGIRSVFLEVRESNEAARRLYESLGFLPCGMRKNFYRHPTESAVLMVWTDETEEETKA